MEYKEYLKKLYRLVTGRLSLGAMRLDSNDEDEIVQFAATLEEEAGQLFDIEEALLGGSEFAPLPYLFAACGADGFERHAAAMLFFAELSAPCAKGLALLGAEDGIVTPEILRITYESAVGDDEIYLSLREDSVFGTVFLQKTGKRGQYRPLFLDEGIMQMILTGSAENRDADRIALAKGYAAAGSPIPRTQKIKSPFRLADLVLPEHSFFLLNACIRRVRMADKVYGKWGFGERVTYGRGVSMLFTGPPGTGKTFAAQAVSNELGMELYRVSLPAVVSKYIGETEQNLNEIFLHAKGRRLVLFFDEADVLFGKRTEIKDSNDKYANMEAAYLLQRMEEYEGVTILATNYRRNFDEAFTRRLTGIITFPFPDGESRLAIWERVLPKELRGGDVDLKKLSDDYELTGSSIKNCVLSAAFAAAEASEDVISMDRIIDGVREEFEKQGKVI